MSPTKEAQALAEKVVAGMMAKAAFSQWLGITPLDIAPVFTLAVMQGLSIDHIVWPEGDRRFLLSDSNGHLFNGKRMGVLMQVIALGE